MVYDRAVSELIVSLIPFSRRWKHLRLRLPSSSLEALASLRLDEVPLLETISVYRNRHPHLLPSEASWEQMQILKAPHLCRASFYELGIDPVLFPLHWNGLTELQLSNGFDAHLPVGNLMQILRQCPKLTIGVFSLTTPLPGTPAPSLDPIVLPHLQVLRVHSRFSIPLQPLIHHLVAPRLREIIVYTRTADKPLLRVPFNSLIQSCASTIETIGFSTWSLPQESTLESLCVATSLTHLKLTDHSPQKMIDDEFLGHLTPTQANMLNCLCHKLEVLELRECGAFSDEALLTLIQGRTRFEHQGIAKLKRIEVVFCREIEMDIIPQIQLLLDAGLEISLQYISPGPDTQDSPESGIYMRAPTMD